eukprot:456811-Amphidinium_carterae.1
MRRPRTVTAKTEAPCTCMQPHIDPAQHSGQTTASERSSSPFVTFLEGMLFCRVDVQCGDGHHNLL